jgi:SAM-dependent methyltransferase
MDKPAKDLYGMDPSRPEDYRSMSLDAIRRRWDRKADRWDADLAGADCHLNEDGAYTRFLETASALVADRAEFCRRHRLVDLACGTGLVLARFIEQFAEGLGLDLSPRMLAVAARRHLPRTRFQEGNGFELARFVAEAGAVLSRGVLLSHYGERWAPVLFREIRRVLVPGGFALLDFLNAEARRLFPSNPDNKTYFAPEVMESLGKQAGFGGSRVLGGQAHRVRMILLEP